MVRYKPAKAEKKKAPSGLRSAIPCLVFMVSAMALLMVLFYAILRAT